MDRYGVYAEREAELIRRLTEERQRKISALARELAIETIDEVQRKIEQSPDRTRG